MTEELLLKTTPTSSRLKLLQKLQKDYISFFLTTRENSPHITKKNNKNKWLKVTKDDRKLSINNRYSSVSSCFAPFHAEIGIFPISFGMNC